MSIVPVNWPGLASWARVLRTSSGLPAMTWHMPPADPAIKLAAVLAGRLAGGGWVGISERCMLATRGEVRLNEDELGECLSV